MAASLPPDSSTSSCIAVIVDIYENTVYDIQQELKHDYPEMNLVVLIGSVEKYYIDQ